MTKENIPTTIRPLFEAEQGESILASDKPEIVNRSAEAKRVIGRLSGIILEHRKASLDLGVELGLPELIIVLDALGDHAGGGLGSLNLTSDDEILTHCLNRLFEELVEEPSNILYVTPTGPDSTRYDAMEPSFWIECLDLLEKNIFPK